MKFRKQKATEQNTRRRPGREPSQVFSYYSQRPREPLHERVLKQSAGRRTIKKTHIAYIPSLIAMVAVVVSIMFATTIDSNPRIQPVTDKTPNLLRDLTVYQAAAAEIINSNWLNRSKLSIDTETIARIMRERFPEIEAIEVTIPLIGRRPVIEIQPGEALFTMSGASGTYLIDQHGTALLRTDQTSSALSGTLPKIEDFSGLPLEEGKTALPKPSAEFIKGALFQFSSKNLAVSKMTLPATPYELHVSIEGLPYYIKMNLQGSVREQVGAFVAVRDELLSKNETPKEYIDVRVEERVFYK